MKQLEVSLLGQVYVLACPDGGEELLQAAVQAVDREMTAIRDAGKVKARERIAVLAALNLAYQLAERAPTGSAAGAAPSDAAAAAEVEALVRKLDAALGADGQLL